MKNILQNLVNTYVARLVDEKPNVVPSNALKPKKLSKLSQRVCEFRLWIKHSDFRFQILDFRF